ncbi:MAG: DUF3237 domain-containing protein [Pseudomonadota bacterium]
MLPSPTLSLVCNYTVELGPIKELGTAPGGKRRIIPIIGGTVVGPRIQGKLLNVGADWQTVFANGSAELDTLYAIETFDGAVIEVINFGYRHGSAHVLAKLARGEDVPPQDYYMRTIARLETGDERYDWVNATVFVGTGARKKTQVLMSLYAVE